MRTYDTNGIVLRQTKFSNVFNTIKINVFVRRCTVFVRVCVYCVCMACEGGKNRIFSNSAEKKTQNFKRNSASHLQLRVKTKSPGPVFFHAWSLKSEK